MLSLESKENANSVAAPTMIGGNCFHLLRNITENTFLCSSFPQTNSGIKTKHVCLELTVTV